ncbi:MAG: prolipoprotein diacylglyceryl transferase, partial [Acidobacteria bacterium]|nr:prolipoprotein diacylglyceryl transferase [Acidobacteriota bacterium]
MFTHAIDPIIATVGGVHLWWYGTGFTLGFWQMHRYVRTHRRSLGLSPRQVYTLSLCLVVGVLAGGRLVEVLFDEWAFYRVHPSFVPRYWLGGMATHGLLIGAASATA